MEVEQAAEAMDEAEEEVGKPDSVRRPAWQRANADALKERAKRKREAWAAAKASGDYKGYRRLCKDNRRARRRMLNDWWQAEARRVQEAALVEQAWLQSVQVAVQ